MAKTKRDAEADEMMAVHRLPLRYAFAIGERVSGPGIVGTVVEQPGPWSVRVQHDSERMADSPRIEPRLRRWSGKSPMPA